MTAPAAAPGSLRRRLIVAGALVAVVIGCYWNALGGPFVFDDVGRDEGRYYYYLRDQKSIATRIPKVFGGVGFYFQGLHKDTLEPFYQYILKAL